MHVTYVDDRMADRDWRIEPPMLVLKTIGEYLEMGSRSEALVIHGGQRDARLPSETGRDLLLEAIADTCRNGGRVVVFSGGAPVISVRSMREQLARESLVEGWHYLLLTAVQNLGKEIDFKQLLSAQSSPDWRISEVKRRHAVPTLWALALLCQSALLAFDPKKVDEEAPEAAALLGGRDAMLSIRAGAFSGDQLLAPHVWHGALGTKSAAAVCQTIDKEWPDVGEASVDRVHDLVDALYGRPSTLDAGTVGRAYYELYRALGQNQESQR